MDVAKAHELALSYAKQGIAAGPIAIAWDERKQRTNKRPLTKHGHQSFTDVERLLTPRLFKEAAGRMRPDEVLGVGLYPGRAGYVVLDPDVGDPDGREVLAKLEAEHGELPEHPIVDTASSGEHRWFRKPKGVDVGNPDFADGINVRADDGWVVAPGTVTPWGSWTLRDGVPLNDAPEPPHWVLGRLDLRAAPGAEANGSGGSSPFVRPAGTGGRGRWQKLNRDALDPRDRAALKALEDLGGHGAYVGSNGEIHITRPGKTAGASATIGHIGPGIAKIFTDDWAPLVQDARYDADELAELAAPKDQGSEQADPIDEALGFKTGKGYAGPYSGPVEDEEPAAARSWAPPRPLGEPVPALPAHALPGVLGEFVAAVAEEKQVPADLPALAVLAVLSTCARGRHLTLVQPGWTEQATLWTCAVLPSGERKSATLQACADPVHELERDLIAATADQVAEQRTLYNIAKGQADKAERDAVNGKVDPAEAVSAAQAFAAMTEPASPLLLVDDITAEALGQQMAAQDDRLAVISAEGGLFATFAGRYNGVPNLDLALKSYSGELAKVHRVTRRALVLEQPALTLGMVVQPEVVRSLSEQKTLRGTGFLARFLYGVPEPAVGRRKIRTTEVPADIAAEYTRVIDRLARASLGLEARRTITLDAAAADALHAFRAELEPRLHPETGDLGIIGDWASKLPGALVRIATLFALVENPAVGTVDEASMQRALSLADYLAGHALAAFALATGRSVQDGPVGAVLAWIRREFGASSVNTVTVTGGVTFTLRDAHRALHGQGWVTTVTDVEVPLETLVLYGYIREVSQPRKPGRPPSRKFEVNPLVTVTEVTEPSQERPAGPTKTDNGGTSTVAGEMSTCAACGRPMKVIKNGQTAHPSCERSAS